VVILFLVDTKNVFRNEMKEKYFVIPFNIDWASFKGKSCATQISLANLGCDIWSIETIKFGIFKFSGRNSSSNEF
jgi:hypothetical protein